MHSHFEFSDMQQFKPEQIEPAWWKETIVYQIYPRSFQDSNGDGIGNYPVNLTPDDDTIHFRPWEACLLK